MPLVGIPVERLKKLVGQELDRNELRQALEQLGNDVEGYAKVIRYRCDRCGHITEVLEHEDFNNTCAGCGSADLVTVGTSDVVRIDLLPVRPDMFDVAGLARALRGYLGIETGLPKYRLGKSGFKVKVKKGLEDVRPFIVAAVVRGVNLDEETVKVVMKMQENLHWAMGRDRRRASIGVYDLATVEPGFEYRPVEPEELRFVPLGGLPEDPKALLTPKGILEQHPKGKAYAHLLEGMKVYPLLADSGGRVLSMPPIINSEQTRVTQSTRDFFIDVTGPDRNAITKSLNVLVTSLAELGGRLETVQVTYPDGTEMVTPDLTPTDAILNPDTATKVLGFDIRAEEMTKLLEKMRYGAKADGGRLQVQVPAFRSDIMHEYDIIEDIAIGYGYHNIRPRLVPTMTVSRPQPVEELSEMVRRLMTGFGFLEVMTLVLSNPSEQFEFLRLAEPEHPEIENPASIEQTMPRHNLLTGLLSTLRKNSTREMPQSIFEVGDCFGLDKDAETGVSVSRRLAAGKAGPKAGFADGRALTTALARELDAGLRFDSVEHPSFIPGRCTRVFCQRNGKEFEWGILGEVHPEVLENFNISQPVVMLELNLDSLI